MKKHINILIALGCLLSSQLSYAQKDNPNAIDKASVNLMVSKSMELYDLGRLNDAISLLKKAELKDTANWKI